MAIKTIPLSTKQVMAGFGVSDMTVYTWRQGTKNYEPLPCNVDGRFVTFDLPKVKAWAKKHELTFDEGRADAVSVATTGPKVKSAPKAVKKSAAKPVPTKRVRAPARAAA